MHIIFLTKLIVHTSMNLHTVFQNMWPMVVCPFNHIHRFSAFFPAGLQCNFSAVCRADFGPKEVWTSVENASLASVSWTEILIKCLNGHAWFSFRCFQRMLDRNLNLHDYLPRGPSFTRTSFTMAKSRASKDKQSIPQRSPNPLPCCWCDAERVDSGLSCSYPEARALKRLEVIEPLFCATK